MNPLTPNVVDNTRLLLLFYLIMSLCASAALAQEEEPMGLTELSETETSYAGARLLRNAEDVRLGELRAGRYDDLEDRDRYLFWQGDSLFLGVIDTV